MRRYGWSDPAKAGPMMARKICQKEEITDMILYWLSDKSSMINCAVQSVDGGFTAT